MLCVGIEILTYLFFSAVGENILRNFGAYNKNNLNSIIQANFTDHNEDNFASDAVKTSSYYSTDQIAEIYTTHKYDFCLISLNCQSINAKFDTLILLKESLKQNNLEFSIICLQETWLEEVADLSLFHLLLQTTQQNS